ncbi:MAG: tetratricopeptide repeat protein [Myxococcota bacterium]
MSDSEDKKSGRDKLPRYLFENFEVEIDPKQIDETFRMLSTRVRGLVDTGRYTKVRLKYKDKPLMPDIPLTVFVATEAVTLWYAGLLRALLVNLGVRAVIEVEFIHDAEERVSEGIDLYMAGEVEAAEAKYREALRMKTDDGAALYNLGVLLRVTARRDEAIECFEKVAAMKNHPDADRAKAALSRIRRGPRSI